MQHLQSEPRPAGGRVSIAFGLATALLFAVGLVVSARLSRQLSPLVVVSSAAVVGLVIVVPLVAASGIPPGLDLPTVGLMLLGGSGTVGGLISVNASLRFGKVGVVAPIVATQGAVAVTLSVLTGRSLPLLVAGLLAVIVVGIVIAARARETVPIPHERPALAVLLALVAATCFGTTLLVIGLLSDNLPLAWLALPARLVATIAVFLPLLSMGRLRLTRRAAAWIPLLALCDLGGIVCYAIGAEYNLEVTAVLASQMAPIATVLAFLVFRERLTRLQVIGLGVIVVGVVGLSLVQ